MRMVIRGLAAAMLAIVPASAGLAQSPADFYRGKTVDLVDRLQRRRRLRPLRPADCAPHGQAHPGQSHGGAEEHGGRRRHAARQLAATAPRRRTAPCSAPTSRAMAFEPLLGNKSAKYDPTKITWIGSANDEVSVCMAWHTSGVTTFERRAAARACRRLRRHRRRHLSIPRDPQQHVRRQVQDGLRLCRRHRDQHRDGARRGAGPLRLPVVDGQGLASALDARQELQSADAVLAREACRPAGRAAGDGPRPQRRSSGRSCGSSSAGR